MCTVCGCGGDGARLEPEGDAPVHGHERHQQHGHDHAQGHDHDHDHGHGHGHGHGHHHHPHLDGLAHGHAELHCGRGPVRAHAPGLSPARMVRIEQEILGENDRYAAANRARFRAAGQFALNLVSSPGSGKTTLLTRTIDRLAGRVPVAVVEGDQQTSHDAERIRATGAPAVQVNTGKGCHLDAHMVGHALERLDPVAGALVLIENVGNLVCPAAFDLGEQHKVVILSVTEGEDKPLKYPDMFHAADLLLLNKIDLLPYLDFDVERCLDYARRVRADIEVLQVSARDGTGMDAWLAWLERGLRGAAPGRAARA
ncbi:MAG TPA: hydrogenase nickel incorporation protein HypB [Gammaproteobacteria bacterium]